MYVINTLYISWSQAHTVSLSVFFSCGVNMHKHTHLLSKRLGDNCQRLAVRSDICKIGQLSDRTTVSADNCQIGRLSVRTTVSGDNSQCGQLSVRQLSVDHGQLSEETVSALKKL